MNLPPRLSTSLVLSAAVISGLAMSVAPVQAAAKTWSVGTGGNISTGGNWNGGTAPVSGDSMVFSNAGGGTVVFDTGTYGGSAGNASSLAGISFTGTPGAYTLDLSSNSFNISNPNAITMASTVANDQTVGTSAGSGTIFVSAVASAGTAFFVNSSTTASLVINSNITKGDSSVSNSSLVFGNISGAVPAGTGNIVVNGNITTMGNGVTKTGTGNLTLAGTNSYTGATAVNSGTLNLTGGIGAGAITVYQAQSVAVGNGGTTASTTGGTLTESTTGVISGAATLTINSSLFAGGVAGTANLAGNNTYTGATTVGNLNNNVATPSAFIPQQGASLTLSGANNGQATITVNPNSTLNLDFSAAGAPTTNILNTTTQTTAVNLAGGRLVIKGSANATNSQRLTVASGIAPLANTASQVKFIQNGATDLSLNVGSINRGTGATIDIVFPAAGTVSSTNTATNGLASSGGLAWGTANDGTTLLGASGTALSAYNGWVTGGGNYLSTNNVDVTNGDSIADFTVSTLRFNADGSTLTNSGTSTIGSDTILITPTVSTAGSTITGGTLRSGTAKELLFINNGRLTVNSAIANSASGASSLTIASSLGQTGTATFTADNTIGTVLNVTNTKATFTGNNTFSAPAGNLAANTAITVGGNAVLTLAGNNTIAGNINWDARGGGTLILAGAGALGTGALITSASGTSNIVKFASDAQVSGGGASTASINWTGGNGAFTQNYIFDRATAGTTAVNEAFSSAYLNQQGTWNLLQGSNYTTGFTLPTLTVSGATTYGSANSSIISTINAVGANVSLGNVTPIASNIKVATLVLNGTSIGNEITGAIADGGAGATLDQAAITKRGTGIWTLKGANTFTGATTVNGGTLVLDYGTNDNSKIASGGVLTLSGGALQLKGGTTTQAVLSTTINTGQSEISQNTGTSTINLGAITQTAGALNIGAGGIAGTTSANANGILGGLARITVGGADWAANNGSNSIVAFTSYDTNNFTSGGSNAISYLYTGNLTATGSLTLGTLKIAPSGAGQSLSLGANQLTLGSVTGSSGLLFTGSENYTISSSNALALKTGAGSLIMQDWGTGVLTLNASLGAGYEKYGTGKVVLGANAGAALNGFIYAGTLQYSADAQLSNDSVKNLTISGSYGSGAALVANTAGGNITSARPISLGAQGGSYIDLVGGNTLTLSGIISGTQLAPANNIVTFGGASAVDATNNAATSGTIVLSAGNTYLGGTTLAGGTVNLGTAENAGGSGPLGSGGTLTFTGGTLQYSASNQFDYSSRFSKVANQSFNIDTNGQNVSYAYGLAGASSSLNKLGNGTLTLAGVNTFTGTTTASAGTLSVTGSLASGSAVTVASGATLAGTGTIGGATTILGTHNPGTLATGIQTFSSDLTYSGGSAIVNWELKDNTVTNAANPSANFDSIVVGGNLNFAGLTTLNLATVPGAGGGTVNWSDPFWAADHTGTSGWLVFGVTGSNTNFGNLGVNFAGLKDSSGADFATSLGSGNFSLSLDGSNIYLNYSAVPEPGTLALMIGGVTTLLILRRRKRSTL